MYYKQYVHDMIYKKSHAKNFHLAFRHHELCSDPCIPGKKVDSAIKTAIMEHKDRNCLEAAWLLQQEI